MMDQLLLYPTETEKIETGLLKSVMSPRNIGTLLWNANVLTSDQVKSWSKTSCVNNA